MYLLQNDGDNEGGSADIVQGSEHVHCCRVCSRKSCCFWASLSHIHSNDPTELWTGTQWHTAVYDTAISVATVLPVLTPTAFPGLVSRPARIHCGILFTFDCH